MALGIPLTDDDRAQWLRALAARLRQAKDAGTGLVMSCSALKRAYRDVLRAAAPELEFVFLKGERSLVAQRLAGRRGHFMPASLLESQFAILEEPAPDEHAWVCDVRQTPQDIVASLVERVRHDA
jgi:gluconokinase